MAGSMVLARRDPAEVPPAPDGKVRLVIDETGSLALVDDAGIVVTPQQLVDALQDAGDTERTAREGADTALSASVAAAKAIADAALPKAGGTLTGPLTLAGDPTNNLHAATKQWVTAQIAALIAGAPGALDTLKELADRLELDESAEAALVATVAGKLSKASNLSDLANAATARTNLGLGSAATEPKSAFDLAGVAAAETSAERAVREASDNAIGRRLLRKLREGIEDASIVIVGDSTSAGYSTTWVGKVIDGLAARYPAYTVKYQDWTNGNTDYNAASTKQTGTGAKTLTVYNCAVASQNAFYQLAPYFDAMIAAKQPDLLFLSHGHNHGNAGTLPEFWRNNLIIATQSILRACPMTEIVLIAQNPRTDTAATVQAQRQHVTEQVAHMSGFGFVNVHRAFLDVDPTAASLLNDPIHPNTAGYTVQANEILRLLSLTGPLGSEQRSTLDLTTNVNALTNGDYASFAVPPTLTGWSATNATLSKDTTNYESPNGYSVKMVSNTAASAYKIQTLSGDAIKRLRGGWITFLARVFIPVGQAARCGGLLMSEAGGSNPGSTSTGSLSPASGQGDWRWQLLSRRIAKDATSINFLVVLAESAITQECSVDRSIVVPGLWPRDIR